MSKTKQEIWQKYYDTKGWQTTKAYTSTPQGKAKICQASANYRKRHQAEMMWQRINDRLKADPHYSNVLNLTTKEDIQQIFDITGDRCPVCNTEFNSEGYKTFRSLDRINGGNYEPGNIRIICVSCNSKKH